MCHSSSSNWTIAFIFTTVLVEVIKSTLSLIVMKCDVLYIDKPAIATYIKPVTSMKDTQMVEACSHVVAIIVGPFDWSHLTPVFENWSAVITLPDLFTYIHQ